MASTQPAPDTPQAWEPPGNDQEFKFEGIDSVPAWVDKNWASYDMGPALAVPAGDILNTTGPYTTTTARVGDTVKFIVAKGAKPAHCVVIPGEPEPGKGTKKLPQVSNASLEDALKTGTMSVDDLGDDAKAQVIGRSPGLKKLIEEGKGAPDQQAVGDLVKVA